MKEVGGGVALIESHPTVALGAKQPLVLACINRLINGALFGTSSS